MMRLRGLIRHRKGNSLIETALFLPLFVLLLMGTAQIGRITYVYYSVQKTLYNLARLVGTRQGANLCDANDPDILNAKNFALSGSSDGGDPIVAGLNADMISIRLERQEADSDILSECECSITGCDTSLGGQPPQYVVVSIPDGFPITVSIPYLTLQTLTFRLSVRVPFGGL